MSNELKQRIRAHLPSFTRYIAIGGFVFCMDFSSYMALLAHGLLVWQAQIISQVLAMVTHFVLNKYLNFRNHERSAGEQFGTYLVVAVTCIVIGVAVVQAWVWIFGTSKMNLILAKCAAVGVNIPIGFIGHKKLTFGNGLRGLVRERQAA